MARKNSKEAAQPSDFDDLDGDLPAPTAKAPPVKRARRAEPDLPAPRSRHRAAPALDLDDDTDPLDEVQPADPIPFTSDAVHAVEQMMAQRVGKHFQFDPQNYPVELPKAHRVYWTELVMSVGSDHFTMGDIVAMKLYCRCAHDIDRCNQMIEQEGDVVHGGRGPIVNPRVKVRQASEATLMTILTKFRNQPASRANSENFQGCLLYTSPSPRD